MKINLKKIILNIGTILMLLLAFSPLFKEFYATEIEHTHIWISTYDSNAHWEYCSVCNEIRNKNPHTYTDNWLLGYESCYGANYSIRTCSCGYNYKYTKPHETITEWKYVEKRLVHFKSCPQCGTWTHGGDCANENGRIGCNNPGTCSTCGNIANSNMHILNGNGVCLLCNTQYFTITNPVITYASDYSSATVSFLITPCFDYVNINTAMSSWSSTPNHSKVTWSSVLNDDRSRTFIGVYTFDSSKNYVANQSLGDWYSTIEINGTYCYVRNNYYWYEIW